MEALQSYLDYYKNEFDRHHHLMAAGETGGHHHHNPDPEYWGKLLNDVRDNPERWKGKRAFDFGCGCGRNLYNLSTLAEWERIDGCDISKQNAAYAEQWLHKNNTSSAVGKTWENNGKDIQPAEDGYYDFIMSHIVFQHISNYSVRYSIMSDMYRAMRDGGLCSLHFMDMSTASSYFEDCLEYKNCVVGNPQYLIDDFVKIGFKDVTCDVGSGIGYGGIGKTYYIKGTK